MSLESVRVIEGEVYNEPMRAEAVESEEELQSDVSDKRSNSTVMHVGRTAEGHEMTDEGEMGTGELKEIGLTWTLRSSS